MANPDLSIDPRILASAKEEFLNNGFEKTSLQAVCRKAGVTTGAFYKRYKGKEDLFCSLVASTVEDLNQVVLERSSQRPETLTDAQLVKAWDMDEADMLWWFQFLYERKEGFALLLRCSEGTVYSTFQHDWVAKMTQATSSFLREAQRRKLCRQDVTEEELHILLTAFWSTIYEPFIHNFSWQQILLHCRIVCPLFSWHKALQFRLF